MEGWLLQHQPNNSQWSKVLHFTYVGSPLDSNHSSCDSKQRHVRNIPFACVVISIENPIFFFISPSTQSDSFFVDNFPFYLLQYEYLAGISVQGLHHQEAGQGRDGDRPLHTEPAGGEGGGCAFYLHEADRCQFFEHKQKVQYLFFISLENI